MEIAQAVHPGGAAATISGDRMAMFGLGAAPVAMIITAPDLE